MFGNSSFMKSAVSKIDSAQHFLTKGGLRDYQGFLQDTEFLQLLRTMLISLRLLKAMSQ